MKVAWKVSNLFKADANLVHDEIRSLGESFTCQQILDTARDERTELHKCFEWNDGIAAEKYRLHQAKTIMGNLVIVREDVGEKPEKTKIRVIVHDESTVKHYKPMSLVVRKEDEYEMLLAKALEELHRFKEKYSMLSELDEILALID